MYTLKQKFEQALSEVKRTLIEQGLATEGNFGDHPIHRLLVEARFEELLMSHKLFSPWPGYQDVFVN